MVKEQEFERFLMQEKSISSLKAVASRMSKARRAAEILGKKLDIVVADDDLMYDSLTVLRSHEDPSHAPLSNALRKYYKFINGKEFLQLRYYHRQCSTQ